jgi:hypothetical protein
VPSGPIRVESDELEQPPEAATSEDEETLRKVKRMRKLADALGFTQAVQALDHYTNGTGGFVEIPAAKMKAVRDESQADHRKKLLKAVQSKFGARTMLALEGLVDAKGKAKAETDWPKKVTFQMDYKSGVERTGVSDDNLAYYGSQIKSEVTIEATRTANTRSYTLNIIRWRSWVVDNYDWEGDKKFGGDNWFYRWLLPTQKQMNRLTKIGKAKSYQRSSRSWQVMDRGGSWTESFQDAKDVADDARIRKLKISDRAKANEEELKEGALPDPPPAEEMLGN